MNRYFTVRIKLNDLQKNNEKLEYRSLYEEMKKRAFTESFFDEQDNEMALLDGTYVIVSFGFTWISVLDRAEEAIEAALKTFYPSNWNEKYKILVSGSSSVHGRNLEKVKSSN